MKYEHFSGFHLCKFTFSIDSDEFIFMQSMPDRYTIIDDTDCKIIHYSVRAPIDTWRQWQWIGQMKILIERRFRTLRWRDAWEKGSYDYTASEFGYLLKTGDKEYDFVELPKPYYPEGKRDIYKKLKFYAQRLHYNGILKQELVFAMALRFNNLVRADYSHRQLKKMADDIIGVDRSAWKIKTGQNNEMANNEKKRRAELKQKTAVELLPSFIMLDGSIDWTAFSSFTSISVRSLQRYTQAARKMLHSVDHITKQFGGEDKESHNIGISDKNEFRHYYITKQFGGEVKNEA